MRHRVSFPRLTERASVCSGYDANGWWGGGRVGGGAATARNNIENIHILQVSSSEADFIMKVKGRGRGGGEGGELGCLDWTCCRLIPAQPAGGSVAVSH